MQTARSKSRTTRWRGFKGWSSEHHRASQLGVPAGTAVLALLHDVVRRWPRLPAGSSARGDSPLGVAVVELEAAYAAP